MAFLKAICFAAGLLFFADFARAQVTIPIASSPHVAGGELNLANLFVLLIVGLVLLGFARKFKSSFFTR